jgi:hypothetical protein
MKALSLIISTIVFFAAGFFFVSDFNLSGELNHVIYMSLLVTLMLVCVVGFLINIPLIIQERKRVKNLAMRISQAKMPKSQVQLSQHKLEVSY